VVKAYAAKVKRRKTVHLNFSVSDDGGSSSVVVTVYRKSARLKRWGPDDVENGGYYVIWTAPGTKQRLSFCVLAQDASGNESKESCAKVTVT